MRKLMNNKGLGLAEYLLLVLLLGLIIWRIAEVVM